MAKWLAAFMDEGLAEWEMPNKNGFYNAWRKLAVYDTDMPKRLLAKSQKTKNGGTSCNHGRLFLN
jgi:uncharacterized protein YbcC (UPF0753/DUF2309 family)